jgi:hypothetical protein
MSTENTYWLGNSLVSDQKLSFEEPKLSISKFSDSVISESKGSNENSIINMSKKRSKKDNLDVKKYLEQADKKIKEWEDQLKNKKLTNHEKKLI